MKIILTNDVAKLGNAGDAVNVKSGYARNFLIPKGYAIVANEKNEKELAFNRRMIEKKIAGQYGEANALAEKLSSIDISISKKVGEEGKLFGSVTNREIADAIKEKGIEIDSRNIILDNTIRKSGVYEIDVKVFREVTGTVKLWVVAEGEEMTDHQEPETEEVAEEAVDTEE